MPPRINIPPVTRIILITLVLQSILSAAIRYKYWSANSDIVIPYLTLIPQLSLVYPWTLLTTTFVENNVFTLAIAALTLYHGGRYLERAWSSREFAKFLLVSALLPNTLCFAVMVLFFTFTRNEIWTLTTIAGTVPLQIAFLVAFSQLVPAHTVTLFRGIFSLRVPRFPLLYLCLVLVLSLTPVLTLSSFLLAIFAFLTSWIYLRFYKTVFPDLDAGQTPYSLRGDASETFAFAEFFPGPAKPLVADLANRIFDFLVAMRLCTPFSYTEVSASIESGAAHHRHHRHRQNGRPVPPGSARAEAERRRALALKALDQRLHAATAGGRPAVGGSSFRSNSPASCSVASTVVAQPPPMTGVAAQTKSAMSEAGMTPRPSGGLLGEMTYVPDQDKSEA